MQAAQSAFDYLSVGGAPYNSEYPGTMAKLLVTRGLSGYGQIRSELQRLT